jgi:hypothetical protein
MKKFLKILLVIITIALLFNLFTSDEDEIQQLIKQGYLKTEYTKEDVRKLCNPQNEEERKAAMGANLMWSCINNGAW